MNIISQYSVNELTELVKQSSNFSQLSRKLGYQTTSGSIHKIIKKRLIADEIDFSHFTKYAKERKAHLTEQDILCKDSQVHQASLRKYVLDNSLLDYVCQICGQQPVWQDKLLSLTLDHINGENHDNRIENLRWVCPNCDRQLDTYGSKNAKRVLTHNECIDCGAPILKSSTRCVSCENKHRLANSSAPSKHELKKLIRIMSFTKIGKLYGVSDNAVRKWCKIRNLPTTVREIKTYSDEQWEHI